MRFNRKQIKLLFITMALILIYTVLVSGGEPELTNQDFIRFHVIANSNSYEDQELKLQVRDGLIEMINSELAVETMAQAPAGEEKVSLTIEDSRDFIKENLPQIREKAENILRENGCDDAVSADLELCFIPKKTYGDITFPAGNYEALRVIIGKGEGENWWCVLFPPLCLIDDSLEVTEDFELQEIYNDAVLSEKYRELLMQDGKPKTLKLKFKTLELLQGNN